MTLYARSDVDYVGVSADGHGGCGQSHSRPVVNGKPVHPWALDCPPCENHLRHDSLFSATISEIPETPDETLAREDFEKRGAKDKDSILTLALARLAGIPAEQLPDTLTQMVSGVRPHLPAAAVVECPVGHKNAVSMRFCGECGQPLSTAPPAAQEATGSPERLRTPANISEPPRTPANTPGHTTTALPSNTKMRGMKREDLATLAADAGVDASGTRAELLERLIKANNGGKANGAV